MTAALGTFISGVCVIGWVCRVEIIKLPWVLMIVQVCERMGLTLRDAVARKANMWQSSGRKMLTVTVTMHEQLHVKAIMWKLKIYLTQVQRLLFEEVW